MRKKLLKFLLNILIPELTPAEAFFVDKEKDVLIIQLNDQTITPADLNQTSEVFHALGFRQVLTVNTAITFKVIQDAPKR